MARLLTLEVISGYTRPVIQLKEDTTCLIDTGADVPVWTQGADRLKDLFEAEKVVGKKYLLSGFGTGYEIVDVYKVHDLVLNESNNDSDNRIIFKSVTVACTSRPAMVADLILPNTAFSHMNLTIRNMEVESPVIEIEHEKDEFYVSPVYSSIDGSFMERVYSFSQQ